MRYATTWNWALGHVALACLGLALVLRSPRLTATGLVLLAACLFNLRMPPCDRAWLLRPHAAQKAWLDAPWTGRKRVQAALLGLALVLVLAVLWSGRLDLLVLLAGTAAVWRAHRSTRNQLRSIARDKALDKLMEQGKDKRADNGP